VTGGIKDNEAIFSSDVAKFAERRQLSGLVANGMRAISTDGRAADFDGLMRPGDHVDVLLSMGAQADSGRATVTVSASVEQAQVATEAMRRGKLTLTLRNNDDITIVEGITETGSKDLVSRSVQAPKGSVAGIATKGGPSNVR
jgi:Flp pilus assembly protein CpaB